MHETCNSTDHPAPRRGTHVRPETLERCARIFRAMGDPARLRLLVALADGPACVGDLLQDEADTMPVISQRLRVLRAEDIVRRKRIGKHVVYALADQHTHDLVLNGLAHAAEHLYGVAAPLPKHTHDLKEKTMAQEHITHPDHPHQHGEDCGHTAIKHDGHTDFLHNGHMHHPHDGHVDEHTLEVSSTNPADCTDGHDCAGHEANHVHGTDCGHEAVPHGDHTDYLVDGHLHHPHDGHCDNHGNVELAK